jgi:hypothetical protein
MATWDGETRVNCITCPTSSSLLPRGTLTVAVLDRGGDELAPAHTGNTCCRHQPGDALATNANAFGRKINVNARRPVNAARGVVRGPDLATRAASVWARRESCRCVQA